jgi:hypothetical protein
MLLRDRSAELEVFMVQRHHEIDFAKGALVFPGGKVDPADSADDVRARCRGTNDLDAAALTIRVAAIRETFEESVWTTVADAVAARDAGELSLFLPEEADYDIVKTSIASLRE